MDKGVWFWLIYVLCLLFGAWCTWPADPRSGRAAWRPFGGNLVLFILLGILGWAVFGAPIK